MQRLHLAVVLVALASAACTQSPIDTTAGTHLDALAIHEGAKQAQATLSDFFAKARQPPAGTTSYAVRVRMQEGRDTEYFWVHEFSWSDDTFTGRIDRQPRLLKRVRPGQTYRFSRSDIVDWSYVDQTTGRTFGNFTGCAPVRPDPSGRADGSQPPPGVDCL
jgi:uncharacterized protein YegJ (DUF2314 family)